MSSTRRLIVGFGVARIAYAAAMIVAPRAAGKPWLGDAMDSAGGRVAARTMVARDAILSAGAAGAALREGAARPWLVALALSDAADIAATLADADGLPDKAAIGTVALAGTAALSGAALARVAED